MEPPGEGRYELGLVGISAPRTSQAAMEPPGEGRYEKRTLDWIRQAFSEPQWSRPVKGGTSVVGHGARGAHRRRNGAAR